MSTFKTFQPLLFDSFKYILPDSTYMDDYKIKHNRKSKLQRNYSLNSSHHKNLTQNEKMTLLMKHKKPFSITRVVDKPPIDENKKNHVYFSPYVSIQDVSEQKETKKVLKSALKTPTPVQYDTWMQTATQKEKEIVMKALNTINQNETNKPHLRSPPPSTSTSNTNADILVIESNSTPVSDEIAIVVSPSVQPVTQLPPTPPLLPTQTPQVQQTVKQTDPHWIVYKQDETPDYIIEAKKRLGQIRQPHIASTPSKPKQEPTSINDLESGSKSKESFESNSESKKFTNKHWLQWENPSTPDYIKAIRHRLRDDRYRKIDLSKKYIEINRSKSDLDGAQQQQQTDDIKKAKISRSKSSVSLVTKSPEKPIESPQPTVNNQLIKTNDKYKNNYPNSTDLSLVGTASGVYFAETNVNEPNYYNILPTEDKSDPNNQMQVRVNSSQSHHAFTYLNDKTARSGSKMSFDSNHYYINDNSSQSVPLQQWMQSAEEKDREDVLRVLKSLDLSRPGSRQNTEQMIKNFVRIKSQNSNTPSCSSYSKTPAPQVRKLGTTRNLYKFPSEKNEKQFIKEYLWNQNGPATMYGYNI